MVLIDLYVKKMTRRFKPAIPQNVQALINANNMHADALEQERLNRAKANETAFREGHASILHNAEVRRNARKARDEAHLARLDLILDRRAKLTQLIAEEKAMWNQRLQEKGLTVFRE